MEKFFLQFSKNLVTANSLHMVLTLFLRSAACNIAIKLLGPRLDRLSYRYSKVIQISDYSCEYQLPCALPQLR